MFFNIGKSIYADKANECVCHTMVSACLKEMIIMEEAMEASFEWLGIIDHYVSEIKEKTQDADLDRFLENPSNLSED